MRARSLALDANATRRPVQSAPLSRSNAMPRTCSQACNPDHAL
jgi:hypothetical protein